VNTTVKRIVDNLASLQYQKNATCRINSIILDFDGVSCFVKKVAKSKMLHRPLEFAFLIACERYNFITSIGVHRSEKCASRCAAIHAFSHCPCATQTKRTESHSFFPLRASRLRVGTGDAL